MNVITATTDRKNVYISTISSEYFADVLECLTAMEADYTNRKNIEKLDTIIDMDAADCHYYTMVVTYYTECPKTAAFAARLVEIAKENAEWVAAQAAPKAEVTEAEQIVLNAIAGYAKKGVLACHQLNILETTTASAMAAKGMLVQYTDRDGCIEGYGLPVVVNGKVVPHAGYHAKGFTCNVAKFVKHMWNDETEENMFHWIRTNHEKFPEYAEALKLVAGEEHEKLDWHGMDQD